MNYQGGSAMKLTANYDENAVIEIILATNMVQDEGEREREREEQTHNCGNQQNIVTDIHMRESSQLHKKVEEEREIRKRNRMTRDEQELVEGESQPVLLSRAAIATDYEQDF